MGFEHEQFGFVLPVIKYYSFFKWYVRSSDVNS